MSKFLEVGGLVVAGVLSVALYNNMNSTQERLAARKSAQLDSIESYNSDLAYRALELGPVVLEPVVLPKPKLQQPSVESEMKRMAAKCFKNHQCTKLAEAVYFEDRGNVEGMKAVANVVINRTNSGKFPDTIVGVVNQKKWTKSGWVCQFSYMCQLKDRTMYDADSKYKAGYVAWKATSGVLTDRTKGADHYLNKSKVKSLPKWVYAFNKTAKIGEHTFYASKDI